MGKINIPITFQLEKTVDVMGSALNKILTKKHPVEELNDGKKLYYLFIVLIQKKISELRNKENIVSPHVEGSLTPPASELGGNDHITLFEEDQANANKRKLSFSSEKKESELPPRKTRKRAPVLKDITTAETVKSQLPSKPPVSPPKEEQKEEEYEVSKIKNFSKREVRQN